METPATSDRVLPMQTMVAACLLVKPAGSEMGECVHRGLLAAGLKALVVPTVYDAVVEADRLMRGRSGGASAGGLRHLIVGVDCFGQQELRLFPLVRREWPQTVIVAYHSSGFEYKGRLAELMGADVLLGSEEDVAHFAESLVTPASLPAAAEPTAETPAPAPPAVQAAPVPVVAEESLVPSPVAQTPPAPMPTAPAIAPATPSLPMMTDGAVAVVAASAAAAAPVAMASPPAPPTGPAAPPKTEGDLAAFPPAAKSGAAALAALAAVVSKRPLTGPYMPASPANGGTAPAAQPQAQPANPPEETNLTEEVLPKDGQVIGTIELTEEELRLLLGEEEEA
jgi:hypothetical protein